MLFRSMQSDGITEVKPIKISKYGCFIELMDGQEPDGCVFDTMRIDGCSVAVDLRRSGKDKNDCEYWRKIP